MIKAADLGRDGGAPSGPDLSMNVLLLGSGGREHAIALALAAARCSAA